MHFSTWSCQHIWFFYFGCIYWQPGPPTEDCKGKYHSSHFSVKSEGCIYKNSHSFFSQYFRQGRPLNQVILMTILIEKSKIKSIASRVRSNSFYWAFKDVDPRVPVSLVVSSCNKNGLVRRITMYGHLTCPEIFWHVSNKRIDLISNPDLKQGARWPSGLERWLVQATGLSWPGSNPTVENFASELWQFRLPRFASVFRRRH